MLPITHCHIALRNIFTGALIGVMQVPNWSPDDPEDETRDLVTKTFDAAKIPNGMKPFRRAADWSWGTFTWGPLMGLWEWLDFGEQPAQWLDFGEQPAPRNDAWAKDVHQAILADEKEA
jgi:hypothetical protein